MGNTNRGYGSPLAEWCQTHSFKEFLELIDNKENTMNDITTEPVIYTDAEGKEVEMPVFEQPAEVTEEPKNEEAVF